VPEHLGFTRISCLQGLEDVALIPWVRRTKRCRDTHAHIEFGAAIDTEDVLGNFSHGLCTPLCTGPVAAGYSLLERIAMIPLESRA